MPGQPVDGPRVRAAGRRVLPATAAIVLVAWAVGIAAIAWDRDAVLRQAWDELSNLNRAYAEHVAMTMQSADQALRYLRAEHRRQGPALDIQAALKAGDLIGSDFQLLGIIGADGFLLSASVPFSRIDLTEREHFRVHVNATEDRLFISKPLLAKATGKMAIQVTRRIQGPGGEFGGVVVASLPPSYFSGYFERTSVGEDVVTSLIGTDGIIRARAPDLNGKSLGVDVSQQPLFRASMVHHEGQTRTLGALDGTDRLWAYRTLERYGLIVTSGKPVQAILATWRSRMIGTLIGIGLFTLGAFWLANALRRRIQSQARLLLALQASTAHLREVVDTMVEGSSQVAAAGAAMSVSAQLLAIRTDEQGTGLQATSGAVHEVVGQVDATASHVGAVDRSCSALREQARAGMSVVARGVHAIEGIASRTREMGDAVSMIETIAFQTNILALNAAVEAARAGDAGRAFAVVASEVRELAARSRRSAVQVRELIARATEQAANGVSETAAVRQVLQGIAGRVEEVANEMRALSGEAHNQSGSLRRVMHGLEELAQITSSNADMVAGSVMAAEEMREHAQRLRQVVAEIEQDLPAEGAARAEARPRPPVAAPAAELAQQPEEMQVAAGAEMQGVEFF